jgi:hypothetical protein
MIADKIRAHQAGSSGENSMKIIDAMKNGQLRRIP